MINVNQITAQLARMPDQALQQYAQMHKTDPYTLSLALAESNRRRQLRQGAQMQAPEQPKVVDQALQSMAAPMPEDVGIGQLPAGNMNFAEGGIVAFADGGVPRYNGSMGSFTASQAPVSVQELSRLYQIDPALAKDAALRAGPAGQRLLAQAARLAGSAVAPLAVLEGGALASSAAAGTLAEASPEQREQFYSSPMLGAQGGDAGLAAAILNAPGMEQPKPTSGGQLGKALLAIPRMLVSDPTLTNERDAQAAQRKAAVAPAALPYPDETARRARSGKTLVAAPTPDTGARPPATARPQGPELLGGSGAATPAGQSIYSLASTPSTYQREFEQFMPQGKVADPFEADVRAQGAAEEKAARDFAARRKQQLEGLGALGAEQEKRLKTREEKLGKQEGELSGMALLQAGFAMMSGASPNALQNIGVGAQAGLKKYGEGIERLDAAREKIDDAFGRLEIARRSEKMLTDKELADVERDADKVAAQTKREVTNSARTAYGLSQAQAGKMFDAYVADKRLGAELGSREKLSREEMQNRLAAAKVTAGAQQGLYQALGSAAPGSPLLKGYEMAKQEGQIPRLYAEYTKMVSDELKGAKFLQQYPTFDAYLAGMGGGRGGFVTPPANAPVLRAPGT